MQYGDSEEYLAQMSSIRKKQAKQMKAAQPIGDANASEESLSCSFTFTFPFPSAVHFKC